MFEKAKKKLYKIDIIEYEFNTMTKFKMDEIINTHTHESLMNVVESLMNVLSLSGALLALHETFPH